MLITRSPRLLMVEDNPADVLLAREAFAEAKADFVLTVAEDGEQALEYLFGTTLPLHPLPDLVLLDLNLPRQSGNEVLTVIKTTESTRSIPVIIYTSSRLPSDIRRVYDLHANCMISKPRTLDEVRAVGRSIQQFWLQVARLPRWSA